MYLGYQNNKVKFYTEQPTNEPTVERWVETDEKFVPYNYEYLPETHPLVLENTKEAKIRENDIKRDKVLFGGVEYRGIIFDSDTDQKTNLMYISEKLSDSDIITWYGMNNEPLSCTKEDIDTIGDLIVQLDSFCWTRNFEIKLAISEAQSVEELDAIKIDYSMTEEEQNAEI